MKRPFLILLLTVLLSLASSFAPADIVTLKDGTTHEGKVIEENGAQVIIEISIANIKSTKTFPRYKVRSIEYTPEEETADEADDPVSTSSSEHERTPTELVDESVTGDEDESGEGDAIEEEGDADEKDMTRAERLAARRNRTLFMVIPVEGMIGEQTSADGLRNALRLASRQRAEHVVFTIDSPGGYVYDAVETLKVLKEFDDAFEYHALVIEGAISAASVYVAAADRIWVRPDARVGGAVAYTSDNSSGAAEVDAKFNSIWAAEIASRAESKGHPPEVFRAMVEPGAEVWMDAEGKIYASRPSTAGAQQLDSGTTVLTMRAGQMVRAGMATEFTGEPGDLGELLDLSGSWHEMRGVGVRAMEASGKERMELSEKFDLAAEVFRKALAEYEENNPQAFEDYRFYIQPGGNRYPDGPSMQKWRERSDRAIRNCNDMLAALAQIAEVNKRAEKIGAIHLNRVPDDMGHEAYVEISDIRKWLMSRRDNMGQ